MISLVVHNNYTLPTFEYKPDCVLSHIGKQYSVGAKVQKRKYESVRDLFPAVEIYYFTKPMHYAGH